MYITRSGRIKIVIAGFYTAANRGDEAILHGMEKALTNRFEALEISVLAHHKEATARLTGRNVQSPLLATERAALLPVYILWMLYLSLWAMMSHIGIRLPLGEKKEVVRTISSSDAVLVSGGGFLNDNYKPAILGRLYEIFFAHILKKPVGIYAHSIGPFNSRRYSMLAKAVLSRVDVISVREDKSKEMVEKMGIYKEVHVVPDAAFSLEAKFPFNSRVPAQIQENTKDMVSISVRDWEYYSVKGGHERYIRAISKTADALVEKGYNVVFCSTCSGYGGYAKDDRKTALEVSHLMTHKDQSIIINEHADPQTLINIYSKMKLHIGTRMHSNIFAFLGGTPFVAIGYEHKTKGMMMKLGMENHVVDINGISEVEILLKVEEILSEYDGNKKKISELIPRIRNEALNTPALFEPMF